MKKLICLCAGVLMIAACDRKSDPAEKVRIAAKDTKLQGGWVSNCDAAPTVAVGTALSSGFQAKTAGYKTTYNFTGNKLEKKVEAYSTTDCKGDANYEYVESGVFDLNNDPKTATGESAFPLNIKYDEVTLKVISDEGVKVAEGVKLCGIDKWTKNKVEKVKGSSSNANCYGAAYGKDGKRDVFTRYKIADKVLLLGPEAANERDRKDNLDPAKYTKKYINTLFPHPGAAFKRAALSFFGD